MGLKVPFSPAPEDIFAMGDMSWGVVKAFENRVPSRYGDRKRRVVALANIRANVG